MASELSMNGRKKIETLQKEFTQKFPYLTLVFLDKERRAVDISKSLSEVRQAKGEDISIIASLKVNTLEKRFLENFGLVVEVAYQKSNKVVYTKDNVEKTLNELNKWCQENDCQPFEFKKSFTGNTLSSVQEQLFEAIKEYYPNAEAKKINKDNYLDIHIPEINKKRGTHLFFNTAKDGIKIGFYCRDEEFIEEVLSKSSNIEKYAQGIRILNNPLQNDVEEATKSALSFIEEITGEQKEKNEINNEEEEIDIDAILKEMGYEEDEEDEIDVEEENKNNISGDNFIKINISGLGSEICMGLIDNKEFQKFEEFYTTNNFTSTNKAWLAYIDKKGKGYWDYNETANLVGILLDELNIKVFDKNGEEIYNSNYYDIDIEIGDNNWRDYNINESKKRGVYIDKKSDKTLVVYKSNEYFSFDFVVPNTTKFEIEKLTIFYSCTDELGHGNDYGDYSNSLKYNEEVYAATEFGQNNLECEVKFISGKDKSEKEFVLEQEDEDIDIDAILEEMGYDDEEEEEEDEDDSTNELDEQNYQLVNALEIFDSETMAMVQMFSQFGITEVGTGSGSWEGKFYTYEYRTEWNEGYLENYDAISVEALIELLKTKNINDFNQDDLGSLGIGTLRNGNTTYENFKWADSVSKKEIKNAPDEEELCTDGDKQDSEYLWDSPERIEFVVSEDDKEDLNFILINKNAVTEESESENDTESDEDEEEAETETETSDRASLFFPLNSTRTIVYDEVYEIYEGMIKVKRNELFGFLDKRGNEIVPCNYIFTSNFVDGVCNIISKNEDDETVFDYINCNNERYFSLKNYTNANSPNKYGAWVQKDNTANWEFYDLKGKLIHNVDFENVTNFKEGFSWCTKDQTIFVLSISGKIQKICTSEEEVCYDLENGLIAISVDEKYGFFKFNGTCLTKFIYDHYKLNLLNGNISVGIDEKWGVMNSDGILIIPCIYDDIVDGNENLFIVTLDDKKGVIDISNNYIVELKYDDINEFDEGYAIVELNELYGIVNTKGQEVVSCNSTDWPSCKGNKDMAVIAKENGVQLIDLKTGKPYLKGNYSAILFDGNTLLVKDNEKWGWIDNKEKVLINLKFDDAWPFIKSDLAKVQDNDKFGFIDNAGNFKIKPIYTDLEPFEGNYAIASIDGESYGLIDKNANQIIEFKYSSIEHYSDGYFKLVPSNSED